MPIRKHLKRVLKKEDPNQIKLVAKKRDQDFIPYVCHYNKDTILTKNGELMKIIRITGFSDESMMSELSSLRDNIRAAISNHIQDNKYALWFHTIRRRKNITPKGEFNEYIAKKINDNWVKKNNWSNQYVNEFYITVITEGLDTSIVNFNSFLHSFSYFTTKQLHQKHLQEASKKLNKVTNSILADIEEYGAKLLGVNEWEGVLYSEPMRFFGKIINLYEDRYPISVNDMSEDLASHKMAFGDRELEVVGENNKNFAAILSLKEYHELPTEHLDRILQLPLEFIITQSFDFTFSNKEIEPYEYQDYILKLSGDDLFRSFIGADDFSEDEENKDVKYGKLQTTFMFIARNKERLANDVRRAIQQFSSLGIVAIREGLFSEHCFWSQLPGNFQFLRRQKVIKSSRIAGFAALHSFPSGFIAGNHWGPAVTVVNSILNTPYFFNFHEKDLGHTLILGPKNSGKTIFINFMLAQARKFNNKIFYFDVNSRSKCFIKGLSGSYYNLSYNPQKKDLLKLNPLLLEKNEENKEFLNIWFRSLVSFSKNHISEETLELIPQVVDEILKGDFTDLSSACAIFNIPELSQIYESLNIWSKGKLSHIFGAKEEINWSDQIIAFDFSEIIKQKPVVIPIVNYLLHRIEENLDGNPAIIVLSEAWSLISNKIFAPQLNEFLVRMRKKNCVVIFASDDVKKVGESEIIFDIKKNIASEIYLPNKENHEFYESILGLNKEEINIVKMMNKSSRHFFLKNRGDSIIASLNLNKFSKIRKILASDEISIAVMEEVIEANKDSQGNDVLPEIWIPQFIEVLEKIEEEELREQAKLEKEKITAEKRRKALV
jgi:type IV secretion system protein VirB4